MGLAVCVKSPRIAFTVHTVSIISGHAHSVSQRAGKCRKSQSYQSYVLLSWLISSFPLHARNDRGDEERYNGCKADFEAAAAGSSSGFTCTCRQWSCEALCPLPLPFGEPVRPCEHCHVVEDIATFIDTLVDIQVTTSGPVHWAVAADLADNSKASKQGWGQTKIGQVLQAKVRCVHVLAAASAGQSASPCMRPSYCHAFLTNPCLMSRR